MLGSVGASTANIASPPAPSTANNVNYFVDQKKGEVNELKMV
jgi:hypothetical protein